MSWFYVYYYGHILMLKQFFFFASNLSKCQFLEGRVCPFGEQGRNFSNCARHARRNVQTTEFGRRRSGIVHDVGSASGFPRKIDEPKMLVY